MEERFYLIYEYEGHVEVQVFDDLLSLDSYVDFMQIKNFKVIRGFMEYETEKN